MKQWIAVLMLMLLLSGCGNAPEPATLPAPTASSSQRVEIRPEVKREPKRYEGVVLSLSCPEGEDSPEAEVLRQAASVFESRTGAEIRLSFGAAEQTDIVILEGGALSGQADRLLDLTSYADAAGYGEHSYPFLRQQVIDRCGSLKAIPWEPELWGIYYNAEIFTACAVTEIPMIWEDYMGICQVLQNAGYQIMALDERKAALATTLHLERSLGWDDLKKRNPGDSRLESALQQILDFMKKGFFSGGWPEDTASLQSRMALRNTAMFVGSDRDCAMLEDAMTADLQWGVFAWPGTGPGTGCAADSSVLAISSGCSHPQAAFDFIFLVATGEFDQLRADMTGRLPADPGNESPVADGAALLAKAARGCDVLPGEMPIAIWKSQYPSGGKAAQEWVRP